MKTHKFRKLSCHSPDRRHWTIVESRRLVSYGLTPPKSNDSHDSAFRHTRPYRPCRLANLPLHPAQPIATLSELDDNASFRRPTPSNLILLSDPLR
jgi:hypothetical protein